MEGVREGEKHIVYKSFKKSYQKKQKTLKVELHLAHAALSLKPWAEELRRERVVAHLENSVMKAHLISIA